MEHKHISKRYWVSKETAMGRINAMAKLYDDVISLSLGDPDMTTPAEIINKAFEDAHKGHTRYTEFRGDPELRAAICKFYKDKYNLDVKDEEVFVTSSGCIAMYLVLEAIVNDGDEIIMIAPYFTPYYQQIELARGIPVECPTYEEEDFQISMERLESAITEKTKAIIINSPSNPSGSCLSYESMEAIAAIAEKYDLVIISDEIYTAYSFERPFVPFSSLPKMKDRTITINSFSKNFLMTGWRLGNIIAPDYIIKVIQQINENVAFTAPSISQRGAIYALEHCEELQKPIVDEFKKRMTYAAERINSIPWMHVITPPKGSFYLFPSIKKTGLSSVEMAEKILQEAHVLTLPGDAFGKCGEGHLRICCTVSIDVLKEAFDRIEKIKFDDIK